MTSRAELLNDQEEAMRLILDGRQASTWTAMPGIVQSVNLAQMTCEVQLSIKAPITDEDGTTRYVNLPVLPDVPLVFPSAGGFTITFPVAVGDEVLCVFASRCFDSWWQSGGIQEPMETRMNDLSDAFAFLGPKSLPHVLSGVSTTKFQIRNSAGTVVLGIGTKFSMANAATDLKTVLTDLETLLNTFMGALAALSGGGAPTPQSALQAPAATAQTALAAVLVKIGALLE